MSFTNKFAIIIILLLYVPGVVQASEWTQEIEVYILASSIEGDAGIGRAEVGDVDVDFSDILEVLKIAGMVHYEIYQESGWGLILDYGFMDLRDDISGPRDGVADFKVRQAVFQADVMYRVPLADGTLDYLGGIRWWDNDLEAQLDPSLLPGSLSADSKEDWVDIFVGARWSQSINNEWSYVLRGDVGGFGLEADFTASISGGFKYMLTETLVLDMQYKATWVDYEDGAEGEPGYFSYNTVTHGPIVGLIYKFK